MEGSTAGKRRREGFEEAGSPEISSPEAKRLLVDILDDDAEAGERDLASIMKTLEEEIALPCSPLPLASADRAELEFLFEASDDELGLPPPSEVLGEVEVAGDGRFQGSELLHIWGIDDDELGGYEGFECAVPPEQKAVERAVFDEGLFEYFDVAFCGSSDLTDLSWRSETLPAV
ncbi:uncharacterized protein LOC121987005 [Zingiber officinale]|uniref:Uncharacterized protein n=1 Tax=Zingiber officinale TaxID=94328 RepID=A0A8J5GEV1_ZINOF|nr:uncharacterized protein LOC121987005 [Zingiber officinale]KAG6505036.1 hypothetical protein ZIOFF_037384 [Zingiber officinale]